MRCHGVSLRFESAVAAIGQRDTDWAPASDSPPPPTSHVAAASSICGAAGALQDRASTARVRHVHHGHSFAPVSLESQPLR
jgi:hypothetical protein